MKAQLQWILGGVLLLVTGIFVLANPTTVMKIAVNGALIEYGGEFLQDIRISEKAYRTGTEYLKGRCASLISFASRGYAIDADDSWFGLQRDMMETEGVRMDLRDPREVTKALGERPCKLSSEMKRSASRGVDRSRSNASISARISFSSELTT